MKIALVGSEVDSHGLAPWEDHDWEIWTSGLSQSRYPRADRHFEVHALDLLEQRFGSARIENYVAFLNEQPSVIALVAQEQLPNAELLDVPALYSRFGPYFFSSTMSWMMGRAIMLCEAQPKVSHSIGLWGIDCTALEEYQVQRPGVQFFINEAQRAGIQIVVPLESDILQPAPAYGLREFDNMFRKNAARKARMEREREDLRIEAARNADKLAEMNAICDYLGYMDRTWSGVNVAKRSNRADKTRA